MRCRFLVVVVVAVMFPSVHALARKGGETASDVTVRERPSDDAPAVRNLPKGAPVVARGRRQGWVKISGAAKGWIPNDAFKDGTEDTTQEEAMLARIAAAGESEPTARTDADLMYDALKQWRGDTPDSAKIDRLVDQSKKESDRSRRITRERIKALFWKDPFSDDPHRLIPVRREDRDLLAPSAEGAALRYQDSDVPRGRRSRSRSDGLDSDAMRLRVELLAARSEVAEARSEIARLRAELSRAKASLSDGAESPDERLAGAGHVHRQANIGHARHLAERSDGVGADTPRPHRRKTLGPTVFITTAPTAATEATAPAPGEVAALPPAGAQSSDPRGIIVVPIEPPGPAETGSSGRARTGR
jgi:hypothetical protein